MFAPEVGGGGVKGTGRGLAGHSDSQAKQEAWGGLPAGACGSVCSGSPEGSQWLFEEQECGFS